VGRKFRGNPKTAKPEEKLGKLCEGRGKQKEGPEEKGCHTRGSMGTTVK